MKNYIVEQIGDISGQACPCGTTRRAFVSPDNDVATMHVVEISADSRVHYHKQMTEMYLVLEGKGHIELDGDMVPLQPMTTVLIKPGCRHRAVGNLKVVLSRCRLLIRVTSGSTIEPGNGGRAFRGQPEVCRLGGRCGRCHHAHEQREAGRRLDLSDGAHPSSHSRSVSLSAFMAFLRFSMRSCPSPSTWYSWCMTMGPLKSVSLSMPMNSRRIIPSPIGHQLA